MKNYFTLVVILFFVLFWTVKALEILVTWFDDSYPNDWFSFDTTNNANIDVSLIDKLSNDYINWKRIKILQMYNPWNNWNDSYSVVWSWVLISQLYWDFYLKYWELELLNDSTINLNCNNVSYSFSWKLYSPWFWEIDIDNTGWKSYYCPKSQKSQITLKSNLLWEIVINWSESIETLIIKNSRWEDIVIRKSDIFDDKKISINWINNIKDRIWLNSDYSWENWWTIDYTKNTKLEFTKNLNKNLIKYTNWITPITDNNLPLASFDFTKRVFYYNYEWQEEFDYSNRDNKWKILTLWDWATESDTVMWVYWQQLLYIKWWNLYIDTDISNSDKKSQLVIVVKRDSKNRQNWGNVYINPDVTNIDAIIIADWSIIGYNWSQVLNSDDNPNILRKQLLIYWALSTKNTYWDDIATYWTDDYISNWWDSLPNIKTYNLARLRSFQIILNDDVEWDCSSPSWKIVAKWETWTWAILYSFAWKKKCFIDDNTYAGLRSTEKVTSLVIEYNPIIQKDPHFILKK